MIKIQEDLPEHIVGAMTEEEALALVIVPQVVTMRQARLALLEAGLLNTIDTAIASGMDEALKIDWEYATEVRRDWQSLITLSQQLNLSSIDLDNLFLRASTK